MINYYKSLFKIYSTIIIYYARLQQIFLKTRSIAPIKTTILLTYKCNCHCYMCMFCGSAKTEELNFNDLKGVIDQVPNNSVISFTGGEATLNKDFLKIVEYAAIKHRTHIRTNGSNLDKEMIKRLIDAGTWGFYFSIDAPRGDIHNKIRGYDGLFEKVVDALKEIKKIKEIMHTIRPVIQVNTIILKESIPYLPEMVEFCSRLGVDSLSFSPDYREGQDIKNYDIKELNYLKGRLEKSVELAKKFKIDFHIGNKLCIKDILNIYSAAGRSAVLEDNIVLKDFVCYNPWTDLTISPDGNAHMCSLASGYILGNIKTDSIRKLWNNKIAQDVRRSFLEKKYIRRECATCCYFFRRHSSE